jgi:TolB-like protein/tetratricopeptide (TPR) repeat protein
MPDDSIADMPQRPGLPTGPSSDVRPQVFISHASQDATLANAVVEALEHYGIGCWIAPRNIIPGAPYAEGIIYAINECDVMLLLLSASAIASSHVRKEVERASSKRRTIITVRIDSASLTASLEYFLSESQWVDFVAPGDRAAIGHLVDAIRARLLMPPGAASGEASGFATPLTLARSSWPKTRVVGFAVSLLLMVGAAFAVIKYRPWQIDTVKATSVPAFVEPPKTAAAPFAPPPHSIAVLPFVNISGDPAQDYFSDGVTEELLNALARLNKLKVVARTSSFMFKGQNIDVATIARRLNVGTILEGSVRKAGATVRITVQLIDANSGFHLWSETYDRQLTDILKVQTDVATTVARRLQISLSSDAPAKLELGGTNNPKAYEAYLRGRDKFTNSDIVADRLQSALTEFNRAVKLDPNYAQAQAWRAMTLNSISMWADNSARADALESAKKAVALAPDLGITHLALAKVYAYGQLDFVKAAPEFANALSLAPGNVDVLIDFAFFAGTLGESDRAVAAAHQAVDLDPESFDAHLALGQALSSARRYGDALAAFHKAQSIQPKSNYIIGQLLYSLLASGQFKEARVLCESDTFPGAGPWPSMRQYCLAMAYHGLGRQKEAENAFKQFEAGPFHLSLATAGIYAQWGDAASALEILEKMAQDGYSPELQELHNAWELDPIRGEPRFKALESKMNFPLAISTLSERSIRN